MSSITYAIVFSGQILEGHQIISVKAHMAKMLKAGPEQMQALFSGKQVVLKRTPDKEQAIKIGTALKKIGADVKIKAVKSEAPAASSAPAATAAPATGETELSLAPNEGNLVEPSPPPPAPDIDLSGISLAENNDLPLATPKEVVEVDIDLSSYSVSDNDGSPLVEPANDSVPEVEAPDFGLDEPGAVLETLQEEKEMVNPDTSGMSLAAAGSDLLDEEEKKKEPPPPAPDTSDIKLVSAFDT